MADQNTQQQLEYLGRELTRLEEKTLSASAISAAVAAGMQQAVSSPEFWNAAIAAMGTRTKSVAGGFLLDGMWGTVRKLAWFVLAGWIVYMAGGWTALMALFKVVFGIDVRP